MPFEDYRIQYKKGEMNEKQYKMIEDAWADGYNKGYRFGHQIGYEKACKEKNKIIHCNPEDTYREDFSAEENPYAKRYNNTWGPV